MIDGNGTEVIEKDEEAADGASDEIVETPDQDGSVEGEGAAEGTEGKEDAGGDTGGDEDGGVKDGGEAEAVDPRDEKIAALEAKIEALAKPKEEAPAPKVYTESEKEIISAKFGGASFETVSAISELVSNGLQMIRNEFLGELSGFKKDAAIMNLEKNKEFADIKSYLPGVNEFLKRFSPQYHSNEDVLKDAYLWAKGKGMKTVVKKIVNSQEKNRRVASSIKSPKSNTNGSSSGKSNLKLTPGERAAYESFGKNSFSSEEEYARSLPRNRS